MPDELFIKDTDAGIIFKIFVQPRSSKNTVVGLHDGALKLKLTAPPVDNAANKMVIAFLSKQLGVSKSRIEIISGHTGRNKQVLLRYSSDKPDAGETAALRTQIEALASV